VLLNSLFSALEKTMAKLPAAPEGADSVADNYDSMATQAMAGAMAGSRGFGIAQMIVRDLLKTKDMDTDLRLDEKAKVSSAFADE
jgi:Rod binding domain-containing protein